MQEDAAAQIHETSLALLEEPGVRIEHDGIVQMLRTRGASLGAGANVVRFPREMVQEHLALCPRQFALTDRVGDPLRLSPTSEPIFWSCPGMSMWRAGEHRPFTSGDMAAAARVLDHLPNVDVVFGLALDDVPAPARGVVGLRTMALNTSKHIRVLSFTPEGAQAMVEMKRVVGRHAWFSMGFTAHGPLRWTNLALEIFKRTAGHGIPTTINGEPMAGVSGPVTLAGCAAVGNAEILAGIVVNQILEPGRPCIYNLGLAHIFDMKTAIAVTGAPENALFARAAAVMGRFYNLPSASWVSTEAMCPDAQAALEKMFGFHTHMECGVTCIWGVGQLESELTFSPAQAVIDNEMIAYARRYARGIQVDEGTLALDTIRDVGIGGSFLEELHTLERFRSELFMPQILFRRKRSTWNEAGRERLDERAEEVAAELAGRDVHNGLSGNQEAELKRIADRFVRRLS